MKINLKVNQLIGISILLIFSNLFPFEEIVLALERKQSNFQAEIKTLIENRDYKAIIEKSEQMIPYLRKSELGISYFNLAIAYERTGNTLNARQNLEEAIVIFLKNDDISSYIRANLFLAQIELKDGKTFEFLDFLPKIIDLAKSENLTSFAAIGEGLIGEAYLKNREYEKAIEQYQKSLKIEIKSITYTKLSKAYNKLANLASKNLQFISNIEEQNNLKQIIDRSLRLGYKNANLGIEASKSPREKIISKLTILSYHQKELSKDKFDQYKTEIIESLSLFEYSSFKASNLIEIAKILDNQESIKLLEEAQQIATEIDDRQNIILANEELGRIHLRENNYKLARIYIEKAITLSQQNNNTQRLFYQFWQLGKIELKQSKKASAIAAYDLALSNLKAPTGEFGFHNLLYQIQEDGTTFLRDYISLLLEEKRASEAIDLLPILKLSEFQDYFNDPCFDLATLLNSENKELQYISDENLNIYTFVTVNKLYLIVKNQNEYTIKTVDISKSELTNKLVRYIKLEITSSNDNDFITPARDLYEIFIKPIENEIPTATKALKISNDGITSIIPWETFIDEEGEYLIEKYSIASVPGLPDSPVNIQGKEKVAFALTQTIENNRQPLIFGLEEVKAISERIEIRYFLGEEFTKKSLAKTISDKKIQWLHIATHGNFDGTAEQSYLESFDSLISLNEFKNILLEGINPIELLTLSGCETAVGNSRAALGFAGMAVRARIPYVLGSLWEIPDDPNLVEFMAIFYQELDKGKTPAQAKRIAQIQLIDRGNLPRYWAGITLIEN